MGLASYFEDNGGNRGGGNMELPPRRQGYAENQRFEELKAKFQSLSLTEISDEIHERMDVLRELNRLEVRFEFNELVAELDALVALRKSLQANLAEEWRVEKEQLQHTLHNERMLLGARVDSHEKKWRPIAIATAVGGALLLLSNVALWVFFIGDVA